MFLTSLRRLALPALASAAVMVPAATAQADTTSSTSSPTATTTTTYRTLIAGLDATDRQVLQSYIARDSPTDTRFYNDGVWMDPSIDCWTCYSSAGTAAAILSTEGQPGDDALRAIAIRTFNRSISDHQNADGSFSGTSSGAGIDTAFWANELGTAYMTLGSSLDAATRQSWATALGRAADYLIAAGDTTWYVNGNINLRYAEIMWFAWKATGEARFQTAYEAEWSFLLAPSQTRWAGYGLQIVTQPTQADGSDGAGYLAESNGGATPGYDPNYTYAQLDVATSIYVMNKDPRALRLMNLEVNQLLKRVDSSWTLDATNGSRKNFITPFMTAALSVLVHAGNRPDLVADLPGQFARTEAEFRGAMSYTHPNFYKGLSGWLSLAVLDADSDTRDLAVPVPTPLAAPASTTRATTPAPAAKTTTTAARPAVTVTVVRATPVKAPSVATPTTTTPATTTPAWTISKVTRSATALSVSVSGVKGTSTVTAKVFNATSGAKVAKTAKAIKKLALRKRTAKFTFRVPLPRAAKKSVVLQLVIHDAAGTHTVNRSVTARR